MTGRALDYYQVITDPDFAEHMISETGLTESQQRIVRSFRTSTKDTQNYADEAGLPLKKFNAVSAGIHRRMMDELFRLALIGYRAEQKSK